jgi:hypothetical protein
VSRHVRPRPLDRRPTVSVVIPCYNYGHYLPTAVASALGQAGVDVELIVVDDASPDGSGAVVQELAAHDDRIRAILHPSNRGHIATYNEGLAEARGDYVVLLSADDALPPGALARASALLEANPSVGLVYGHPVTFVDESPQASERVRSWTVWPGEVWIERVCRSGRNCIMNPEVVMRTSLQHAIAGYDPELPHSGDIEMWMRAAAVSDIGRVNGPPQGFYRVHGDSMQRTTYAGHVIDLEGLLDAFEKVLVGPGARVSRGPELFEKACRGLAGYALEYARAAYDHGRASEEPVDEYTAFAARVWPAVQQTRTWRALQRRAAAEPGRRAGGLTPAASRLAVDLRWRVRWRRWRWSGV